MTQYEELKEELAKSTLDFYSQVLKKEQSQPRVMHVIDHKEKNLNIDPLEPKEASTKYAQEFQASQVQIRLDQVNMVDKIELHKRIGEIIFYDRLQSTISNEKLQENLEKL